MKKNCLNDKYLLKSCSIQDFALKLSAGRSDFVFILYQLALPSSGRCQLVLTSVATTLHPYCFVPFPNWGWSLLVWWGSVFFVITARREQQLQRQWQQQDRWYCHLFGNPKTTINKVSTSYFNPCLKTVLIALASFIVRNTQLARMKIMGMKLTSSQAQESWAIR